MRHNRCGAWPLFIVSSLSLTDFYYSSLEEAIIEAIMAAAIIEVNSR